MKVIFYLQSWALIIVLFLISMGLLTTRYSMLDQKFIYMNVAKFIFIDFFIIDLRTFSINSLMERYSVLESVVLKVLTVVNNKLVPSPFM